MKILSAFEAEAHSQVLRNLGNRIVLCRGCFDILHIGHIRHLEAAKKLGDILVVSVTSDRFVNKGINRPIFPENIRAGQVASLACVDYVTVSHSPNAVEVIHQIKPHVYVKGQDYKEGPTPNLVLEREAVESYGGRIEFTNEIQFSSSAIAKTILETV